MSRAPGGMFPSPSGSLVTRRFPLLVGLILISVLAVGSSVSVPSSYQTPMSTPVSCRLPAHPACLCWSVCLPWGLQTVLPVLGGALSGRYGSDSYVNWKRRATLSMLAFPINECGWIIFVSAKSSFLFILFVYKGLLYLLLDQFFSAVYVCSVVNDVLKIVFYETCVLV